ncbi:MAG: phosphoribosylglycinamide formyltransferase [Thaumarchaeota archaeon]|nr:phosphoribosylglycinamide formyltransferase [Nitrososphaerota archaeon]
MLNIGVLVSGRGSNLESILDSIESGAIKGARVSVVVSNDPDARALRIARKHRIPAVAIQDKGGSREDYDMRINAALERNGVVAGKGLVLLAGYMKVLSKRFVELHLGRLMNIHPSLLPSFPGLKAQEQALSYGAKVAGCTVHFVVPEVDAGPIIAQTAVQVKEDDNEETLSARILRQEHRLYPHAVRLFAEGRLSVEGRRVRVSS